MFSFGEADSEYGSMGDDGDANEARRDNDEKGACIRDYDEDGNGDDDDDNEDVECHLSSSAHAVDERRHKPVKVKDARASWKIGSTSMTPLLNQQRQRQQQDAAAAAAGGGRRGWPVAKDEGSVLLLLFSSSALSKKTSVFLAPKSLIAYVLATTLFLGVICGIVLPYLGLGRTHSVLLSGARSSNSSSSSSSSNRWFSSYFSFRGTGQVVGAEEEAVAVPVAREGTTTGAGSDHYQMGPISAVSFERRKTCNPYSVYGRLVGGTWRPFRSDCPSSEVLPILRRQYWGNRSVQLQGQSGVAATAPGITTPELLPWLVGRTIVLVGDSQDRNAVHDVCLFIGATESMHSWNGSAGSCVAPMGCPRVCRVAAYNLTIMSFFVYGLTQNESIPWTETHKESWEPVLIENRLRQLLAPFLCALRLWPDLIVLNSGLWDLANWGREAAFSGVRLAGTGTLLNPILPSEVRDLVVPDSELLWWLSAAKHRFVGTVREIFPDVPLAWRTTPFVDVRLETVGWQGAMGLDHVSLPGLSADVAHGPYQVVYVDALNQAALQLTEDSATIADVAADNFSVSEPVTLPSGQVAAAVPRMLASEPQRKVKTHAPLTLLDWNKLIRGRWELVKEGLHYQSLGYTLYLEMVLHHVRWLYDNSLVQHLAKDPPQDVCQIYRLVQFADGSRENNPAAYATRRAST
ncbi:hypothetical protein CBR_g12619 [Chara braunii]|uniref:Uncharacterized protein n=1 Tax=Chara braunii TaxID=69332 RepID=A0A388KS87_CHABU|nr:hypothetical protein CBR_g12619 [Chara braunii]|eukprot:GBG72899.1 hypothetical protein CBR_g12619 [Chara braunii]